MKKYLLFLLSGAALWAASCANNALPAGPSPVISLAPNKQQASTIRVMTYNVHHCNPPSKPNFIDIEAITKVIQAQKPDLVALQEIDVRTKRSGAFNQAEEIARKLNMQYFFGKAIDHEGGEYGVAILSKFPLTETMVNRLPTETKGEPRILATAKVMLPNGTTIRFGSTHLDAQRDSVNRQMQITEINRLASKEKLPFIVAGDFNAAPSSNVIKQLDKNFTRTCQQCEPTIPVENPTKAIDFIAYMPANKFKVISNQVIPEKYASDHLPVIAEISLQSK